MPKKKLQGTIVSNKMEKTVVVKVERIKEHPKYEKRYKVFKKYKADTGGKKYEIDDKVTIEECRPMSRDKRWKVVSGIEMKNEK